MTKSQTCKVTLFPPAPYLDLSHRLLWRHFFSQCLLFMHPLSENFSLPYVHTVLYLCITSRHHILHITNIVFIECISFFNLSIVLFQSHSSSYTCICCYTFSNFPWIYIFAYAWHAQRVLTIADVFRISFQDSIT